jgi:hypothetical protein
MAPHCCDAALAGSGLIRGYHGVEMISKTAPGTRSAGYSGIGKVRVSVASACTGTSCGAAGSRSTNCIS